MREDKESHHGTKRLVTLNDKQVSLNPGLDHGSWENWPSGRTEPNIPIFNDKDFPVLTAQKNGCSDVSSALTKISNKLGLKEGSKELTPVTPRQAPSKEYHPHDPKNPDFNVRKYYSPFAGIWICPWTGCK
jgi:hypothetical protein